MHHSRLLLLTGCALILASCGGGGTPAVQPSAPAVAVSSVSGMVVENASTAADVVAGAWTGGAGTVSGQVTVGAGVSAVTETVATADLTADGQFSLSLPDTVADSRLHAFTGSYFDVGAQYAADSGSGTACTGTPALSTGSARGMTLLMTVKASTNGSIVPLVAGAQGSGVVRLGSLVYVDQPLTVRGRVTCSSTYSGMQVKGTVSYDLNLAGGWNALTITESSAGLPPAGGTYSQEISLSSGGFPTDQWVFSPHTAVVPVRPDGVRAPTP